MQEPGGRPRQRKSRRAAPGGQIAPGLVVDSVPQLDRPLMLCAFAGWNDAGQTATGAVKHLMQTFEAPRFARIEPEEFYVFTETRPTVSLVDGDQRRLDWPANDFHYTRGGGSRPDLVLLSGVEPQLSWGAFTAAVLHVARLTAARGVLMLGGLLADVSFARPVRFTGGASDPAIFPRWRDLGIRSSRYEGPTGIVGVLSDGFRHAGLPLASVWASVPHYINVSPNPRTLAALVRHVDTLLDLGIDLHDLEESGERFDRQVEEAVAQNPDVRAYVRQLEEAGDEEPEPPAELPASDTILAELEEFLRERLHGDEDDDEDDDEP